MQKLLSCHFHFQKGTLCDRNFHENSGAEKHPLFQKKNIHLSKNVHIAEVQILMEPLVIEIAIIHQPRNSFLAIFSYRILSGHMSKESSTSSLQFF